MRLGRLGEKESDLLSIFWICSVSQLLIESKTSFAGDTLLEQDDKESWLQSKCDVCSVENAM